MRHRWGLGLMLVGWSAVALGCGAGDGSSSDTVEAATAVTETTEVGDDVSEPPEEPVTTDTTGPPPPPTVPPASAEIVITPEDDAARIVRESEPGTSFRFTEGVHRISIIEPRDGDMFTGERDAVLSGAVLLEGFEPVDDRWVIGGQTAERTPAGFCEETHPRCVHPENLFVDDEPLRHVASIDEVTDGTWYFDYPNDEVHIGTDPTGRTVELGVVRHAFISDASDVVIQGLVIEKFAPPAQTGAIHARDAVDWTIVGNRIHLNHSVGLYAGPGATVSCNSLVDNAQHGLVVRGADIVIERNTISRNNFAHFSIGWSAGGTKFVETTGLVVRDNLVTANHGPGLWTDVGAVDTLYEANVVIGNHTAGIHHEISYSAVIRDNIVLDNGSDDLGWVWGAGIQLANVSDVEVTGNVVQGNRNGIIATAQDRGDEFPLGPIDVHDNVIRDSGRTGVSQSIGDQSIYENGLVFRANRYEGDVTWGWLDSERSWEDWQGFGQDVDGTYTPVAEETDFGALEPPGVGCFVG